MTPYRGQRATQQDRRGGELIGGEARISAKTIREERLTFDIFNNNEHTNKNEVEEKSFYHLLSISLLEDCLHYLCGVFQRPKKYARLLFWRFDEKFASAVSSALPY
jgi:hypothetical protein